MRSVIGGERVLRWPLPKTPSLTDDEMSHAMLRFAVPGVVLFRHRCALESGCAVS